MCYCETQFLVRLAEILKRKGIFSWVTQLEITSARVQAQTGLTAKAMIWSPVTPEPTVSHAGRHGSTRASSLGGVKNLFICERNLCLWASLFTSPETQALLCGRRYWIRCSLSSKFPMITVSNPTLLRKCIYDEYVL